MKKRMEPKKHPEINDICAGCGYTDPVRDLDQHRRRDKLNLHSGHTGVCPITGTSIDPERK